MALWLSTAPQSLINIAFSYALLLIRAYIRENDRKLKAITAYAAQLSPNRWSPKEVERMVSECELDAPLIDDQLPPKSGRRFIVNGGVRRLFLSMKCIKEALGGIHGWMEHPGSSSLDMEKTPSLQSVNHYEHDYPFTFQSPPVLLATTALFPGE
ncbi:hypothetical protein EDD85DRAFT_956137 [Armillaria nabsnona]|nr:hypothetical protein EDD85DRAFT_956137 [Armillaria nabsnona]